MDLLLKAGCKLDSRNHEGLTALDVADKSFASLYQLTQVSHAKASRGTQDTPSVQPFGGCSTALLSHTTDSGFPPTSYGFTQSVGTGAQLASIGSAKTPHSKTVRRSPAKLTTPEFKSQTAVRHHKEGELNRSAQWESQRVEQSLFSQERAIGTSDFKVHCLLGTGSFGDVFLVEKTLSGKLYAMKVLLKSTVFGSPKLTQITIWRGMH